MHEATRVYSDKLVDSTDNESFQKLIVEVTKKSCEVSHNNVLYNQGYIQDCILTKHDVNKYKCI